VGYEMEEEEEVGRVAETGSDVSREDAAPRRRQESGGTRCTAS